MPYRRGFQPQAPTMRRNGTRPSVAKVPAMHEPTVLSPPALCPRNRRSSATWAGTLRTGISAGIASELMVAACGLRDAGSASAGINATSQWLWGRRARHRRGGSIRYTLVGFLVHQLCSFLWSALYASWNARRPATSQRVQLRRAAAVGLLAATVDYTVTPRRLRPGFEAHLGRASMVGVYGMFALGLDLAARRQEGMPPPLRAERGG